MNMKCIFANNFYYIRGGAERIFFDEIDILKRNGHQIVPFARAFEKNLPSEYSRFFPPPIEYENVSLLRKCIVAFKLTYSFESKQCFLRLFERFTPDLIHAHNIYGRLTTSILDAAYMKNIPVVMTLHDYKMVCPSYLLLSHGSICEDCRYGKFYHAVLNRCHKNSLMPSLVYTLETYFNDILNKYKRSVKYFICTSNFSFHKLVEMGFPKSKLIHIPNFIKIENCKPNFYEGDYLLFVGRLSKEKGVLTLLKAVKGLDVSVKIVGDGPMRADYEAYVDRNKMNNVSFEGYRTGEKLVALFRNAAFLVFPSECYENGPIAILEAFAYGKPVIGSDLGGIAEMIMNQETGLLFKPGDHHDLHGKICVLLSNPSMIPQMGKKARKRVECEYNQAIHYHQLMSLYKRACL